MELVISGTSAALVRWQSLPAPERRHDDYNEADYDTQIKEGGLWSGFLFIISYDFYQ